MSVVECAFPSASMVDRRLVESAYYRDSYRVALTRADASVTDIFLAVFAHFPRWMKLALLARNRLGALAGLRTVPDAAILHVEVKDSYAVGDSIGRWPIFALSADELVAGANDKHLDFRVSVFKETVHPASAIVSTVCKVHNMQGKLYLAVVVPFHRWAVPRLLAQAAAAGRV